MPLAGSWAWRRRSSGADGRGGARNAFAEATNVRRPGRRDGRGSEDVLLQTSIPPATPCSTKAGWTKPKQSCEDRWPRPDSTGSAALVAGAGTASGPMPVLAWALRRSRCRARRNRRARPMTDTRNQPATALQVAHRDRPRRHRRGDVARGVRLRPCRATWQTRADRTRNYARRVGTSGGWRSARASSAKCMPCIKAARTAHDPLRALKARFIAAEAARRTGAGGAVDRLVYLAARGEPDRFAGDGARAARIAVGFVRGSRRRGPEAGPCTGLHALGAVRAQRDQRADRQRVRRGNRHPEDVPGAETTMRRCSPRSVEACSCPAACGRDGDVRPRRPDSPVR